MTKTRLHRPARALLLGIAAALVLVAASGVQDASAAWVLTTSALTGDNAPLTPTGPSDGVCVADGTTPTATTVAGSDCNTRINLVFSAASELPGVMLATHGSAFKIAHDLELTNGSTSGDFTGGVTVDLGFGCSVLLPLSTTFKDGGLKGNVPLDSPSAVAALSSPFSWSSNLDATVASIKASLGGAPEWRRDVAAISVGPSTIPINAVTFNVGVSGFATAYITGNPSGPPIAGICTPLEENIVARGSTSVGQKIQVCATAGGPDAAHGLGLTINPIPPSVTAPFAIGTGISCSVPPSYFLAVDLDGNCATTNDSVNLSMSAGGTAQTIGVCVGGSPGFPAPGMATVGYDLPFGAHVAPVPAFWTINTGYYNGDGGVIAAACAVNNTSAPDASVYCNLPGATTGVTAGPGLVASFPATICKTVDGPVSNEALAFGPFYDLADANGSIYEPVALLNASISCPTTIIANAGGDVTTPSGIGATVVRVSFPAGALGAGPDPVLVKLSVVNPASQPPPPPGRTATLAIDLETIPVINPFASPVTIKIPYDPLTCNAACAATLGIQVYESGAWVFLGGTVDTVNHVVSVDVTHFTPYQLTQASAVGGIAERPDVANLPAAAAPRGHSSAWRYTLAAAGASMAAAALAAGWSARRRRLR